jgi:hypothetical protein
VTTPRSCVITITEIKGGVRGTVTAALRQYADDIERGGAFVVGVGRKVVVPVEVKGVELSPKQPLTAKQRQVYAVLVAYHTRHTYMPSTRETAKLLGISSSHAVHQTFQILARKGYIEITPGVTRGIKLL